MGKQARLDSFFGGTGGHAAVPEAKPEKGQPSTKESGDKKEFSSPNLAPAAEGTENQQRNEGGTASPTADVRSPTRKRLKKASDSGDSEPKKDSGPWPAGAPVPYYFLASAFSKVEAITGRIEITAILAEALRHVLRYTPEDLLACVYLAVNKLAPAHEGVEIGIGESILLKALVAATGRTLNSLREQYRKTGDLGDVAMASRTTQKTMFPPPPLTVRKVFAEMRAIAKSSGKNAQEEKSRRIQQLLVASKDFEAKYIARALQGKLRIHLADKTVIAALAAAVVREYDGKNGKDDAAARLNQIYNELPVWDRIIPAIIELKCVDERLLERCQLTAGVPVGPMLAKPSKAITEVLEKFAQRAFTCEYKYDGERAQIHRLEDGTIKIYSRNAEDNTLKYPDIVDALPKALKDEHRNSSFVIDAEAVAFDKEKNEIRPFQVLQGRKRKDVKVEDVEVRVCVFAFDILYLNGKSLLQSPLEERRRVLRESFQEVPGEFTWAKADDGDDIDSISQFLEESVKAGCEGLMVKALNGPLSTYEPANRSQNWLKVKKDYLDGMGDTLDLVPIGGYFGRGKRTGTFGGFLMACYDPETEEYQTTCKLGTGFSDEDLATFGKFFQEEGRILDKPRSYIRMPSSSVAPSVWFVPSQVWEIKCADLSISPAHTAAIGQLDAEKGIALRFPRFLRVRDDKSAEEATTSEQVAEMYRNQSAVKNNRDEDDGDE